jgi:hypothetical protein
VIEIAKDEPKQDLLVFRAYPESGPGGFGQVEMGGLRQDDNLFDHEGLGAEDGADPVAEQLRVKRVRHREG